MTQRPGIDCVGKAAMSSRNFFSELKRRNVYRAAVAYAVVGWLLIQIATQVFPFFEVPAWGVRLVIIILVIGFPFALLFAWAFEITPEGLKRTEEVAPQRSIARSTGRKLDRIIIVVFALVIAILVLDRFRVHRHDAVRADEKSVAVLPFDNYSGNKEDAFFADGIQDDILTSLAKIRDLKVISRTSVAGYRGQGTRNLRDIARALGVTNILEGSVRRGKDRVLVNVQLIDALNDRHLWADRYDRTLDDAISLQGELATEIAAALRATLSPEEKARVETKPTRNAEAYTWYLKGREADAKADIALNYLRQAEDCYQHAVALDPKFSIARAELAQVIAEIYHEFEPTEQRAQRARAEAEEALRSNPNLGEAHLALAKWFYWIAFDYETALRELAVAEKLLPNNADVALTTAAIRRRQGRWRESNANFKRALKLDPRNAGIVQEFIYSKFMLRDWEGATALAANALQIDPTAQVCINFRVQAEYFRTGDAMSAEAMFDHLRAGEDVDGSFTLMKFELAMIRRDFAAAQQALAQSSRSGFNLPSATPLPRNFLLGCIELARGDTEGARPLLQAAASEFERFVDENPNDATRRAGLGWVYGLLGRKVDAVREAQRAVALKPESKDAVVGPKLSATLALIYAHTGELDAAMNEIERLIVMPGAVDFLYPSITQVYLRDHWMWDPLRNHPRFQRILAGPEPKTDYQ
jgi:TolB-like protein/Tfp pilus assembly protein PilF